MNDFKMRADTPRVVRSPFMADDQTAYVMYGELFEDGRSRLVVGVVPSQELEAEIIAALDEADHQRRVLDAVTTIEKLIAGAIVIEQIAGATDG